MDIIELVVVELGGAQPTVVHQIEPPAMVEGVGELLGGGITQVWTASMSTEELASGQVAEHKDQLEH